MSFSDKAMPYVVGAGIYFLLVLITAFYPAYILGMAISRMIYGVVIDPGYSTISDEYSAAVTVHFISTIVIALIIFVLFKAEQYFIVLALYIITLWPFLYILRHLAFSGGVGEPPIYPLPLDWCFLF